MYNIIYIIIIVCPIAKMLYSCYMIKVKKKLVKNK